jgi:ankyrin repeat protein
MKFYKLTKSKNQYDNTPRFKSGINKIPYPIPFKELKLFNNLNVLSGLRLFTREYIYDVKSVGDEHLNIYPDMSIAEFTDARIASITLKNRRIMNTETITELLEDGADVHISDDYPIIYAVHISDFKLFDLFIKSGANINARSGYPLRLASGLGYPKLLKKMIECGVDLELSGEQALISAVINGQIEIIEILLDYGVKPDSVISNLSTDTPLEIINLLYTYKG